MSELEARHVCSLARSFDTMLINILAPEFYISFK